MSIEEKERKKTNKAIVVSLCSAACAPLACACMHAQANIETSEEASLLPLD